MTEPNLKPCPFCGCKDIDPNGCAWKNAGVIKYGPACNECGATVNYGNHFSVQAAFDKWNERSTRLTESDLQIKVAEFLIEKLGGHTVTIVGEIKGKRLGVCIDHKVADVSELIEVCRD